MNQLLTQPDKPSLVEPYGGQLKRLVVEGPQADELYATVKNLPTILLSDRALCDLELLAVGGFSPLDRFMGEADFKSVVESMRLANGTLWPIPITLPVDAAPKLGGDYALLDQKRRPLGSIRVEEVYEWDRELFAREALGTTNQRHPVVAEMARWGSYFVSGPVTLFSLPIHYDFAPLRLQPAEVRQRLIDIGNPNVVAFQTRNPLHRAHEEMTKRAMEQTSGTLLLHPVVGMTKPGDIEHHARIRSYKSLAQAGYDSSKSLLALLPLAMRFAGPREALWHAIIRRNYGANHFIVGRDHASPGVDDDGRPFFEPYAAARLAEKFSDELGVDIISFEEFVYLPDSDTYEEESKLRDGVRFFPVSGTRIRDEFLNTGSPVPEWMMRKEVAEVLREHVAPLHRRGVCLWFTGLSGAGKSTTAEIVSEMLAEHHRRVTLLDGDVVRMNLSAGLGFDREGRDANIRRIGFVAAEIVHHGGVAVCAAISPYRETRDEVRKMVGSDNFVEIFVDTPVEVCEERDPKGMYAKARRGEIKDFTGVDDVYEEPFAPEVRLDTITTTAEENSAIVIRFLIDRGFLRALEDDE